MNLNKSMAFVRELSEAPGAAKEFPRFLALPRYSQNFIQMECGLPIFSDNVRQTGLFPKISTFGVHNIGSTLVQPTVKN